MTNDRRNLKRVRVVRDGEGEALWFLAGRMETKADGELSEGRFALFDQRLPPLDAPPRHVHRHDDEAWYFLEGDATFLIGDDMLEVHTGDFVFAPKGVEHTFMVGAHGARVLLFTAPASFADFVREMSEPATSASLPGVQTLSAEDQRSLAVIAERHGIDITGPPPTPSDLTRP